MSWDGYFTLDGQEIINVARTEAYAAGQGWFRPAFENDDLPAMLGDVPYSTPLLDNAPWTDPDVPESYDFFGYYPLDVSGIEDSTRSSTVTEYTTDGASPGRIRHGSKSVVFNGLLLGANEKAVAYGAMWLRRVLLGDRCSPGEHNYGTDLTYVSSEPSMDNDPSTDPEATLAEMMRTLRRFTVNTGPTITSRRVIRSCGGAVWTATFTGIAGVPWQFGPERPVLQGYLDPAVVNPYVPGVDPGIITPMAGWREVDCGADVWSPIFDPECPALVAPPTPPSVPLGCFVLPQPEEAILDTNLSTNPSVETNATNWGVAVAFGTGARMASGTTDIGSYAYRATVGAVPPTTASSYALQLHAATAAHIPAVPGQLCGWRIRARVKPGTVSRDIQLRLRAYAGATAGPAAGFGTANITVTEEWQEFAVSGVLPAGNDGFAMNAALTTPAQWLTNNYIEWDGSQPWRDVDPGADSYFDGSTPDDDEFTYNWTGADHASTSTKTGILPEWDRYMASIPASVVPLWGVVAPVVTLNSAEDVRGVRLRLYEDPDGTLDPSSSPCAFSVDLVVSYVPADGTLVFDSALQQVWVETVTGERRRADSLVFTTEGKPFEWPDLTCGYGYLLTVDVPAGATPPSIDLSLVPKVA